ncbi:uncharacterized protein ARMOST_03573 [Armillaria ostoyae]|uniref:Uncharacterized protein n=1 Tax=Armillaria ostoyae TaxID=47428 RepID=A0A284QV45_ARMOS|nr:uncharacterized protein ARMOST_03573 [Armillaria ostoyae]
MAPGSGASATCAPHYRGMKNERFHWEGGCCTSDKDLG